MPSGEPGDSRPRIEHDEFQRGHLPEGAPPVEPRPAATIVVARQAEPTFEVLLLERPQASRFAAGAFVFPGGATDEDDSSPAWGGRLPPTGEQTACAAALRELFEETLILPAAGVSPGDDSLEVARRDLLAGRRAFSTMATEMGWDFSEAPVAYFARWITPRTLATRFDTRFFLLASDVDPAAVSITAEHESAIWVAPDRALERFGAGELPLLFPTRKTLERLGGFASLERAFEGLREHPVEPVLAKLDLRGPLIRPLMPGDSGYDEVY